MTTDAQNPQKARDSVPASLESQISRVERHGYLFGTKLKQSWSPFLHSLVYEYLGLRWAQLRLDSSDMDNFLSLIQHPDFYGASVTMPNKVAILPHLDEMTDECRDVGACNTLFLRERNGRRLYCGANTDVIGVRDSFYRNVSSPQTVFHGRPALVIGGGGAARSAVYALRKWMKVTTIYVVNRDADEGHNMMRDCASRGFGQGLLYIDSTKKARGLEGPGSIVACVPDHEPRTETEKQAREIINIMLDKEQKGAMLEMCYNPTPHTMLGAIAGAKSWQVILGTEALIWQGLEQDRYWTGNKVDDLPVEEVQAAIAQKLTRTSGSKL